VRHVSVAPHQRAARSTGRAQPPSIVWVVGGICGTRDVSDAVALGAALTFARHTYPARPASAGLTSRPEQAGAVPCRTDARAAAHQGAGGWMVTRAPLPRDGW
jgi:hypothetical protein